MNKFVKTMCFIGGANLDILEKCPTEKNGFIATGIGIIITVILSFIGMTIILNQTFFIGIWLAMLISIFYGFIIFIGYWGVLSIYRKSVKYTNGIKFFTMLATILISFIAAFALSKSIGRVHLTFGNLFRGNQETIFLFIVIFILSLIVYLIPVILKGLINSSTYEEERQRIEANFVNQKQADIMAYQERYNDYATLFNDANIKMDSIKQLSGLSKDYHSFMEKVQRETFDYLNRLDKVNEKDNELLNECKLRVEEQFKLIVSKMGEIFGSVYKK